MPSLVGSPSQASADGAGTTISVVRNGVTAGNAILAYVKGEDNVENITSITDGTTNFTANKFTHDHGSGGFFQSWFYLLASIASGNLTYTVTLSANRSYKRLLIFEISYTGTISVVTASFQDGSTDPCTTPSISNTEDSALFFASHADFSGVGVTGTPTIGGSAVDGQVTEAFDTVAWKAFASQASRSGSIDLTSAATWISSIIALQETAGGGGGGGGGGNLGGMFKRSGNLRPRQFAPGLAR